MYSRLTYSANFSNKAPMAIRAKTPVKIGKTVARVRASNNTILKATMELIEPTMLKQSTNEMSVRLLQ